MTPIVAADDLRVHLQALNVHLHPSWVSEALIFIMKTVPSIKNMPIETQANHVLALLLDTDLALASPGALPLNWSATPPGHVLSGRFLLQLNECFDAAQPLKTRFSSTTHAKRCLKLSLQDGATPLLALEWRPIPALNPHLPAGVKLLITDPLSHRGILLLRAENVQVLGGRLASAEERRQRVLTAWAKPPRLAPRAVDVDMDLYAQCRRAALHPEEVDPAAAAGSRGMGGPGLASRVIETPPPTNNNTRTNTATATVKSERDALAPPPGPRPSASSPIARQTVIELTDSEDEDAPKKILTPLPFRGSQTTSGRGAIVTASAPPVTIVLPGPIHGLDADGDVEMEKNDDDEGGGNEAYLPSVFHGDHNDNHHHGDDDDDYDEEAWAMIGELERQHGEKRARMVVPPEVTRAPGVGGDGKGVTLPDPSATPTTTATTPTPPPVPTSVPTPAAALGTLVAVQRGPPGTVTDVFAHVVECVESTIDKTRTHFVIRIRIEDGTACVDARITSRLAEEVLGTTLASFSCPTTTERERAACRSQFVERMKNFYGRARVEQTGEEVVVHALMMGTRGGATGSEGRV